MSLPYLACSRHSRWSQADFAELAAFLGVEAFAGRPLPTDRMGLVLGRRETRLHVPGLPAAIWHPGFTAQRIRRAGVDTLVQALRLVAGETVLDATLGLGHDALVLRAAGALVLGVECNPLLLFLTAEGHAGQPLGPPLHVRLGDFRDVLHAMEPRSIDHVYLDPLFPASEASPGIWGTWAPVRAAGRPGRLTESDLALAASRARRSVVVKRAPGEVPLAGPAAAPRIVRSIRSAYAVYSESP